MKIESEQIVDSHKGLMLQLIPLCIIQVERYVCVLVDGINGWELKGYFKNYMQANYFVSRAPQNKYSLVLLSEQESKPLQSEILKQIRHIESLFQL